MAVLTFQRMTAPCERLDALVGRLVQAYATQRLAVMKLMTANCIERLRTKALEKFSDSFILARRKGKDG